MNEQRETSIYPIVKDILLGNTSDEQLSEEEVKRIANIICERINIKYIIERKE